VRKIIFHPVILIFLLAFFLRTYQLSSFPPGFHVDEVKAGWNAYSLWKTGRDDWLHPFPLHYDTFGDQRPTGFFYAAVPSLSLFGLSEFAVRFTPALFGSLAVIAIFFLSLLITHNSKLSLLASFMLAVSPWHISLSRASSEGIISATLVFFGLTYLLKRKYLLSGILLILSYFFYHTARLLVPLYIFIFLINQLLVKQLKETISLTIVFVLALTLTLALVFSPAARGRLSQVSIFTDSGIKAELTRF
jgi:asparagine N-glycosylation enzyme membrane subunit Stt3